MTEIKEYVSEKKELYKNLISFIETDEIAIQDLANLLESQKISDNGEEMRTFIHLIMAISNNHQRNANFFDKIEKIILIIRDSITQNFSPTEIFNLFKSNNRILLFLFNQKIIPMDQTIADLILESYTSKRYFFPEIKTFVTEKRKQTIGRSLLKSDMKIFENFNEKRLLGENDSYICSLIRNDSVEEFIKHINRYSIPLSGIIKQSIFETNSFLIDKDLTLIEYAAFFGSIQIFNYLRLSNVELTPSLWIYAIHSKNGELIHLLEEYEIKPTLESFEDCLEESIKCHHNDVSYYIIDNLLDKSAEENNREENFYKNMFSYCFHYYNYEFFPDDFNHKFIFHYLCKYDYFVLVKLLLKTKEMILNSVIISKEKILSNFIKKFLCLIKLLK